MNECIIVARCLLVHMLITHPQSLMWSFKHISRLARGGRSLAHPTAQCSVRAVLHPQGAARNTQRKQAAVFLLSFQNDDLRAALAPARWGSNPGSGAGRTQRGTRCEIAMS